MIITINQIMDAFRQYSDEHAFIKDFGVGPTSEIGTTKGMKFPYHWISLQPSTINVVNKTTIPELTLFIFALDQVNNQSVRDESGSYSNNEGEIMSDTFQYIQDIVTFISLDLNKVGIKIEGNPSITPVHRETKDDVSGWFMSITLRLMHVNCEIPYKN